MTRPVRALLVADDAAYAEAAAAALERERERVEAATVSRVEAVLDALDERRVDCVVSGYELPSSDGLALLERVRAERPELPFVLVTDGTEGVAGRALAAGVTDCLRRGRPDQHAVLANRVTNAVDRYRAERAADRTMEEGNAPSPESGSTAEASERPSDWHRTALRNMSEGLYVVDADHTFRFVNYRVSSLTEHAEDDWRGRSLSYLASEGVLSAGEVQELATAVDEVVAGERAERRLEVEPSVPAATGTVEVRLVPLAVEGRDDLALATTRDVTTKRERERELERYEALVEEVTDIVTVIDETGVVRFQSPSVEPVLGYEPSSLEGDTAFELVHPEDHDRVVAEFAALVDEAGSTKRVEYRMRHADGSWRWLESKATHRTETPFDGYVVTSRDVTERKRREDALGALHEATRSFMDAPDKQAVADRAVETARTVLDMPMVGLWLYDADAEALEPTAFTDDAAELLGELPTYDDGESLTWDAFEAGEVRVYDDLTGESGLHNPDTAIESELILSLGEYGAMNVGATTTQAFDDIEVWLARILANTTEAALARADREAELRARRRELARQNERLEEFASIVSHDLRNPLTVLDGSLAFVGEADDDAHRERCRRAVDRMQQLVDDLLTLTRQGHTVESVEPVALDRVARESWETVATGEATLRVETDLVVEANESRLRQLLENLFRNAVEHGSTDSRSEASGDSVAHGSAGSRSRAPEASTGRESTERGHTSGTDAVTVTVGAVDDGTGFFVADDGPGIPEEARERLFESGYSTTRSGTGLGLSIVEQTAHAHGWEVTVTDAANGSGSTDDSGDRAANGASGARFEIRNVDTPP